MPSRPPTREELLAGEIPLLTPQDAIDHPAIAQPTLGWIVATMVGVALVYTLSILAHELGHLLAARRRGVEFIAVALRPFGGYAEQGDDEPLTAGTLAAIGGAGPLVTAILTLASGALLLALGWPLTGWPDTQSGAAMAAGAALYACFVVNWVGLVVNLLPFRWLDGGLLLAAAQIRLGRR
jgi:Zn-dependent protease